MLSRAWFLILIFTTLTIAPLFAQTPFDGEVAHEMIRELCKPEFGGRLTGLPGARKAAEWIAAQYQSWGLRPGGDDGSYLQEFPLVVTRQKSRARMKLKNGEFGPVSYQEGNDFHLYFNSGSAKLTADVVFVGYGISAPGKGWDDYAGIDARGKIVLICRGKPDDGQNWSDESGRDYKMQIATEKGAAGLLMMSHREFPVRGGTIHEKGYNPELAAFTISKKVAQDIFHGTFKRMEYVLRDLPKAPASFDTGKKMSINVKLERVEPGVGENVIGILPGTDPVLKNEYMVIGAHMDHNGISPDGHAYYGADDNASGTSVIMELARTMAAQPNGFKRSIVFIGFGGEERGLLGSKYFSQHPTIPVDQICLMTNYDMQGCGDGGAAFAGRNYFQAPIDKLVESLSDSVVTKFRVERGWGLWGSDHASFLKIGIPAIGFGSTGDHAFYHRVEDTPEAINTQSLQSVGDRSFEILSRLADWPESLLFDGNRTGRYFLLFGDQMDFDADSNLPELNETQLTAFIDKKSQSGIRAVVLPVNGSETDLYAAIDSLSQLSQSDSANQVRFEGNTSFNVAAAEGKLVIAMGLRGTDALNGNLPLIRNLSKIGLDVLQIARATDPIFTGNALNPFGKKVLQICSKHGVCLDWTLSDSNLMRTTMDDFGGKGVIRLPLADARKLSPKLKSLVTPENRLLIVECDSASNAADVSILIDELGSKNLHISVAASDEAADAQNWRYRLIQNVYQLRLDKSNQEDTYDDMVRTLGGNLKNLLN